LKIKNLKNILITIITLILFSVNANAEPTENVLINFNNNTMTLTTPDLIKNTVFKRFNDLWIVFSKKNVILTLDNEELKNFGISSIEKLVTKNGTGYRLRFNNANFKVNFTKDYEKRTLAIIINKDTTADKKHDTIKFRVENTAKDSKIKQLFLDSTYVLDYAYSLKTGESYVIAISNNSDFKYYTKQVNNGLYFLPTYSGAVIISEKGDFLKIVKDEFLELSDNQDEFFEQASKDFSSKTLDDFFYTSGIDLIEKQERDYSVFNNEIKNYKASNDYNLALTRLNNALSLIENIDFIKSSSSGLSVPIVSKLNSVPINETEVFDMSGKDDGMFETVKKDKETIDLPESAEDEILVSDFSSDNLAFLMEKLRLISIKQSSSFQKEKVTIKRMQINAYKSYFAEILDLTRLLNLDISGEFPKNNKALALYTLASAQMNRCTKAIQLPEKDDNIYTKDIRLWKAYCLENQKNYESALVLFKLEADRIETYPAKLKNDLLLSYAITLRNTDNYKHSTAILTSLNESAGNEKIKDKIKYYLGLNYLYQNEPQLAEKQFKELLFSKNKEYMYKARFEYLNMLLQKDDVDKKVIIKALEELRFSFRGDETELEATKVLASLYLQEDYIKQAMEIYKYISIYFSKTDDAKHATEVLFNIFYNLFSKNQVLNSNMDDIGRLALFYDFIELTPSEYEGNKIITNVVDDLIKLGLYDNAIKLLNIQLNYKTKDIDIAQNLGEKLADLYLKTAQLDNALQILELTQKFKDKIYYTQNAKIIMAKVLLLQNKTEQAVNILELLDNNLQAKYLLAGIYWNNNDYDSIIYILNDVFLGKKIVLDEQGIINLSYLMLSFALTGNFEKIQQIKALYLNELKKVNLESKIEFLLKLAGADVKVEKNDDKLLDIWQNVIKIDNETNDFLNKYEDNRYSRLQAQE
jgi:hypothetical protein